MAVSKKFNEGPEAVAGNGSKLNPKKPDYRSASGYDVEEDVNAGPHGGKKGKVSPFHDQNSDNWAAEHNKLVGQSEYQKDPYRAKGSDFPVKAVDAFTGQSGAYRFSAGRNELVSQSINQEGSRHSEDDGSLTPVPGDRSRVVAAGFPIGISKGEGNSDTGEISISEMVDLECGYIVGGDTGVTDRVPESKVSVGKPPARNMKAGMVGQQRKG